MDNFYEEAGRMALGSKLRRISEVLSTQAKEIYKDYNVDLEPRWFPLFYLISHEDGVSITDIAEKIDHTHASVSQMVTEMKKKGLILTKKDKNDGRKSLVFLSKEGKIRTEKIRDLYPDVRSGVEDLFKDSNTDIWEAINELEYILSRKSLVTRVRESRKIRESTKVEIIDYSQNKHKKIFQDLNYEWIEKHFEVEKLDDVQLKNPSKTIIGQGGAIYMATYNDDVVGTCAMIKIDDTTYELCKMAVRPDLRGKNIGWLLGKKVIEKAKSLGAKKVFLESNTILKPAINLYHKLGFKKVTGHKPSDLNRCNIQMEIKL